MPSNYLLWPCYHSTVVPQVLLVYTTQICKWIETNLIKMFCLMYCLSQSMSWQDRGEGGGEIQKGERKGRSCLLSPQSPFLSLNPHPLPPTPHTHTLMHSTLLILVVHGVHAIWTQFPEGSSRLKRLRCPTGILEGHGFETVRETDFCFVLQPSRKGILAWSNFASHLPWVEMIPALSTNWLSTQL